MKILFYNWVQFDDKYLRGGGVSVYLNNIISRLLKYSVEIYFLSCGQHYDLLNKKIRFEQTENIFGSRVKSYRIINSPIKAPAHDAFCNLNDARYNEELGQVFEEFVRVCGGFDIIHFHNIEGLTLNLLKVKDKFPNTKVYLTAHNYHIICPQIELFKNGEEICENFHDGKDCIDCLGHRPNMRRLIRAQKIGSALEKYQKDHRPMGDFMFNTARNLWSIAKSVGWIGYDFKQYVKARIKEEKKKELVTNMVELRKDRKYSDVNLALSTAYLFWRKENIELCNGKYIDKIISVSNLVKEVLTKHGIDENKIITLHNGMDYFSTIEEARKLWELKKDNPIKICFFGYSIKSKGFDLFIKTLKNLNSRLSHNVEIVVASRLDWEQKRQLNKLIGKFRKIYLIEGYNRKDVPSLMAIGSIGVIASKWQETYCQVAAELMAFGTPILISNTVGIRDFIHSDDFIFESGSASSLTEKLEELIVNKSKLDGFWDNVIMPPSVDIHVKELYDLYMKQEGEK